MVERRGGNLDLAGGGEPPVCRQHAAHDLALLFAHAPLVIEGEVAAALDPAAHLGVIGLEFFVEPGELRPHLHVAQFLGAEQAARAGPPLGVAHLEELAVARVAVDHVRRIGVERVLQQVFALVSGQIFGRLEGEIEERVARLAGSVLLHLRHHGGHEVKGLLKRGEFFEDAHHAVVIFERVHARPGELVLAGNKVLIKRLMHVPQEAQIDLRHGWSAGGAPYLLIVKKCSAWAAAARPGGSRATGCRSAHRRRSGQPPRSSYVQLRPRRAQGAPRLPGFSRRERCAASRRCTGPGWAGFGRPRSWGARRHRSGSWASIPGGTPWCAAWTWCCTCCYPRRGA